MKAYGKSWGYNVYDCRYCLYRKGKLKGCVYPDGCCCPVPQKPARRNGIEQVYDAAADSAAPVSECEGCPYGKAAPCIGWCTKEVMRAAGLPNVWRMHSGGRDPPKRSCAPQGFQRSVTEAMYDYFYGAEAEQFSFYRIPKVLFTEERFRSVSAEAKVLYGLLLDRMSLSCKNGWLDKEGRVYIIFTIEEVMTALGCADQKAGKLLHELESKCRLIERKRQGLGKPNLIYVKNFVEKDVDNPMDNTSGSSTHSPESRFQNRENHDSGAVKITDQKSLKSRSNNTENNDTDFSDTDSFPFTSFRRDHGREAKGNETALRERYRELIAENIAYDALLTDYPYEQDTLEEILELLVDVVCTTKSSVRISGDDKPAEVVRSRFLKLNSEHIRFVVGGLKENTTRIRNMRQYLLATLYNAPLTIGNYYRSLVSHDMSEGFI